MIQTKTLKEALKDPGVIEVVGGLIAENIVIRHWADLDAIFWNTTTSLKRYTISSVDDYNSGIHPGITGSVEIFRAGGTATIQQFTSINNTISLRSYNPQASIPKWSKWTKI